MMYRIALPVVLSAMLAVGACARGPSPVVDGSAPTQQEGPVIGFENAAQTYVDVYLVGEKRQLWLGRVPSGARRTLRIPNDGREIMSGFVRLAVLEGTKLSIQAARDPHAALTVAQPAPTLLGQQWTFSQQQAGLSMLLGTQTSLGRP
jgi:hypothetical protein